MLRTLAIAGAVFALQLGATACTTTAPEATANAEASEEANKAIVIAFYNAALNEKNWEKASKFIGPRYVQHNQAAVDGPEGIKAHIENLKTNFPLNHGDIKRALADGDLVALHIHVKRSPDVLGFAVVDLFRVENGKVVEHWDVVQSIPEPKNVKNSNTMF
jgi:predicted SnoaL-like aldol condensation-catalyzing enzyme